jgi:hypothetical protein
MNITFSTRDVRSKNRVPKRVKLEQHVVSEIPAKLTYVDDAGVEHDYNGNYNKTGNSYSCTQHVTVNVPVNCVMNHTYKTFDSCFTYMDPDNVERVFSKFESLSFDGTSYTGDVDVVEYVDTIIDLHK